MMKLIKITTDFKLIILSLATILFVQSPVYCQNEKSNQDKNQESIIRIDSTLVNVPTIVSDRDGRYVTNLKKDDFRLFENGIEQEIAFFQPVEQPFTMLLLLDVSGSMYNDFATINDASDTFLSQLRPDDYLSAAAFNDSVNVLFKFSSVREIKDKKRFDLKFTGSLGDTMIYDAVDFALDKMKKIQSRKKAIILFSDGEGVGRYASAKSTLRDAEEQKTIVYTVQFDTFVVPPNYKIGKSEAEKIRQSKEIATLYMTALAARTGGRHYHLKDIANLETTFREIAGELSQQYSLGYYPKEQPETSQERQIKVKVTKPNLSVRARASYVAQAKK